MPRPRSLQQQEVIKKLQELFKLEEEDANSILFLDKKHPLKPWYPYGVAMTIARQSNELRDVAEHFSTYIEPLRQLVHSATVTDSKGRTFTRPGVATLGEKMEGEDEDTIDEHRLAGARAINSALDMAGFNPVKLTSSTLELNLGSREDSILNDAEARSKDLRQIHTLAREKGLIKPFEDDPTKNDVTGYFNFLLEKFGTDTTAQMAPAERAQVINALQELQYPGEQRAKTA
ncbi:MAG TPA: hypothetical protein VJU84_08785 [Pyrinomonadaceae bacterium]|nr:hypothetical protein [Pyrinomonadaceae bacterium]